MVSLPPTNRPFRPDLFHGGLFPHVFVFQLRDLEAVVDEVLLGRVSLLDLVFEHFFLRVFARIYQQFLHFGGHLLEDALADDQRLELIGVMDFGEIFLVGFIELIGLEAM